MKIKIYKNNTGLKKVYELSLKKLSREKDKNKILYLIRSVYDKDSKTLAKINARHIEQRTKLGIITRALTPPPVFTGNSRDDLFNIVRCMLPGNSLDMPLQVMIFADMVALTLYKKNKNTCSTIAIENKELTDSFRIIFEYMWQTTMQITAGM